MITKCEMTDISATEMRDAMGGLNSGAIQFLRQQHNLTRMQVSLLKYHNRLEDPAKFQNLVPDGNSIGVHDPSRMLG